MTVNTDFIRGLVLYLDPDALEECGATYTCAPEYRAQGVHFFVCLDPTECLWLPVFTKHGPGRVEIPMQAKTGSRKWVVRTCHYHPSQVWTLSPKAIAAAIRLSSAQPVVGRNMVDPETLPQRARTRRAAFI